VVEREAVMAEEALEVVEMAAAAVAVAVRAAVAMEEA